MIAWIATMHHGWVLNFDKGKEACMQAYGLDYKLYRTSGLDSGKTLADFKDKPERLGMNLTLKATDFWRFWTLEDAQTVFLCLGTKFYLQEVRPGDFYRVTRGQKVMGSLRKMIFNRPSSLTPRYEKST